MLVPSGRAFGLLHVVILRTFITVYSQEPSKCTNTTVLPNGENVSQCCVFPFVYLGEKRHTCIKSGETAWCSATANFDNDGQKIPCLVKGQGGESELGEGNCHNFPSGLSGLTGGPKNAVMPWKIQCQSSFAMTSLWDDGNRFRLLGDIKCCDAPVDHNISQVFNLSRKDGGSYDPSLPWKAQCSDNYIVTGLYVQPTSKLKTFGGLTSMKCSIVLNHYVDYKTCSVVYLPDSTGGSREPGVTWKTECPPGHFIVGFYNDRSFIIGVKKIKCCALKAVAINQKLCTFEQGMCKLWSFNNKNAEVWKIRNSTMLENGDHTIGKTKGHVIYMTNFTSSSPFNQITSIGLNSSDKKQCLSLWFIVKKFSRLSIMAFRYDKRLKLPVSESLGDIEGVENTKWSEKQVVLPVNTNYQLLIAGFTSLGALGMIALDDIQMKPEPFCSGVCSSLGPLQASGNIHQGPVALWQASCLQGNSATTKALMGLWDKQGSHFQVIEYIKCCNLPITNTYEMSLVGLEEGPISKDLRWNAQCDSNHILTGIYSLDKFNGLYQLQCGSLQHSRIDYSKCVVIWSEMRNHLGEIISLHNVECPPNMAMVAMYDHHGDNNKTSFSDVDAIKCCDVILPNCVTQDDCHDNAKCASDNGIKRCSCKDGFHGNGKYCQKSTATTSPPTSTTATTRATSKIINKNTPTKPLTFRPKGTTVVRTIVVMVTTKPDNRAVVTSTRSYVHSEESQQSSKTIIVTVGVASALLVIFVFIFVLVWRIRKAKMARHTVVVFKEAEMAPMNGVKCYDNICGQKDEPFNGVTATLTSSTLNQTFAERKAARAVKARSATILSADHPYMDEKDLDSKPRLGQPFYFELDKSSTQKTYTIHQSLALPEPMYGILEPENEKGDEIGAQFCTPAKTEEELYLQLSRAIQRNKIEVGSEKLGSGAFGHVWLGVWDKSPGIPVQVAVKILRDSHSAENKIKFLQEAAIMRQFTHKNVIYMYGTVTSSETVMIVLEYMSRGNLKNFLRDLNSKHGEDIVLQSDTRTQFLRMARDIAAGMQYLHSLSFVHRDLAARNILLDSDMTCKIGDFGMSRDLVESDYYTSSGGRIPVKWTSPEAINFGKYSSSSDVWSYGVVLYEIWSLGHKPYLNLDNNEVIQAVSLGYRLPPPLHCPSMVYCLMVDCWHPDIQLRPRSYQIYHCLSFSHQSVFLNDSPRNRTHSLEQESTSVTQSPTYMDLTYVYSITE